MGREAKIPGLNSQLCHWLGPDQWAFLIAQLVKILPAMQKTRVRSLGQENVLEEGMATHCSALAWEIPWTEEPGGLQSSQRVGHNRATKPPPGPGRIPSLHTEQRPALSKSSPLSSQHWPHSPGRHGARVKRLHQVTRRAQKGPPGLLTFQVDSPSRWPALMSLLSGLKLLWGW